MCDCIQFGWPLYFVFVWSLHHLCNITCQAQCTAYELLYQFCMTFGFTPRYPQVGQHLHSSTFHATYCSLICQNLYIAYVQLSTWAFQPGNELPGHIRPDSGHPGIQHLYQKFFVLLSWLLSIALSHVRPLLCKWLLVTLRRWHQSMVCVRWKVGISPLLQKPCPKT